MKPRLLDLYCCAGGAGRGYALAGFDVTGVDIAAQPHYPYRFVKADALEHLAAHGHEYDAIHASPPCQRYANVTAWRGTPTDHPDLVDATRDLLNIAGRPWVIENVPEAPVRRDYLLCGTQFGLRVRRHRAFEVTHTPPLLRLSCRHRTTDLAFMHKGERDYADALGCSWMSSREGRQAIPPAYTEFIGGYLLEHVLHQPQAIGADR